MSAVDRDPISAAINKTDITSDPLEGLVEKATIHLCLGDRQLIPDSYRSGRVAVTAALGQAV